MIDRQRFYDKSRILFGKISSLQLKGMEVILNEWEGRALPDLRWLAYILATTFHETGKAMQPVEENGRGKGHKYGAIDPLTGFAYYGRGFVQLSWSYNYQHMSKIVGIDLYKNPNSALIPQVACEIMFEGMIKGMFTGKKLSDYFHESVEDWVNARRIINSLDRATLIAMYAKVFYNGL